MEINEFLYQFNTINHSVINLLVARWSYLCGLRTVFLVIFRRWRQLWFLEGGGCCNYYGEDEFQLVGTEVHFPYITKEEGVPDWLTPLAGPIGGSPRSSFFHFHSVFGKKLAK